MKESKSVGEIIKQHFPLTKKHYRRKRWSIAQSRTIETHKYQRMRNEATENDYHRIIAAVKANYLKPNEVFFERNYKHEETENFLSMHCLMTATCYLYLECDFCYDFQIEFAFYNCPFEQAIRQAFTMHPLNTNAKEKELQPDFKTFFERVLKVQDQKYIHTYTSN